MNERNVEALAAILEDSSVVAAMEVHLLAELLADRGALVPSALTDENTTQVYQAFQRIGGTHDRCVAALERIAKGDTA